MSCIFGEMATAVENQKDVGHRATQKAYWTENSLEATVEAMMLDSQAASIDKLERPEVCQGPTLGFPAPCIHACGSALSLHH